MDWRAAIWAGLIAGAVLLILQTAILAGVTGGSPWVTLCMIAAMVMGEGVLPPPATFDPVIVVVV